MQFIFDLKPGDIFGSLADLGWVAGLSSVVYAPLCNGATSVLFESVDTYPDRGMYSLSHGQILYLEFFCRLTIFQSGTGR